MICMHLMVEIWFSIGKWIHFCWYYACEGLEGMDCMPSLKEFEVVDWSLCVVFKCCLSPSSWYFEAYGFQNSWGSEWMKRLLMQDLGSSCWFWWVLWWRNSIVETRFWQWWANLAKWRWVFGLGYNWGIVGFWIGRGNSVKLGRMIFCPLEHFFFVFHSLLISGFLDFYNGDVNLEPFGQFGTIPLIICITMEQYSDYKG